MEGTHALDDPVGKTRGAGRSGALRNAAAGRNLEPKAQDRNFSERLKAFRYGADLHTIDARSVPVAANIGSRIFEPLANTAESTCGHSNAILQFVPCDDLDISGAPRDSAD